MSRLNPPPEVQEIAARLRRAGFEAWCVGGAVRDALLGHPDLDWDLATSATPPEVMRVFRRTVPVGIAFGTVGVLDRNGRLHEVTTFRHDVKTDGRHAEVEFGASLEEDLARRDFTINAIAYNPQTGELLDPFNGRADLKRGLVRAVGDAEQRMKEDRLRALRGLRFASRFGFDIDAATWKAICNSAPFLQRLSAERVKQEIEKTMEQVARPSTALARWREAGALRVLVPHLHAAPLERFVALDYLAVPGLKGRPQRKVLRLAMLRVGGASDAELRRWAAAVGRTAASSWWRLNAALWCVRRAAGESAPPPALVASAHRRLLRIAYRDAIELSDLQVDGEELAAAGVPKGPALGAALKRLLETVIEDPAANTRETLIRMAREFVHAERNVAPRTGAPRAGAEE